MIKRIKTKLRRTGNVSVFHDSKTDVATLTKVCIELIEKVNELTDKVNELSKK